MTKPFLILFVFVNFQMDFSFASSNLKLGNYWRSDNGQLVKATMADAYNYCCKQNGLTNIECVSMSATEKVQLKTHIPSMNEIAQIQVSNGAKYSKTEQPGLSRFDFLTPADSSETFYSDLATKGTILKDELGDWAMFWTTSSWMYPYKSYNPPMRLFALFSPMYSTYYGIDLIRDKSYSSNSVRCVTAEFGSMLMPMPLKAINFDASSLHYEIKFYNISGYPRFQATTMISLMGTEMEQIIYTNTVEKADEPNLAPFCTKVENLISCNLKFKTILPECAIKESNCDLSSISKTHNVTLNFTMLIKGEGESDLDFNGKIISDDGIVLVLNNKNLRSYETK